MTAAGAQEVLAGRNCLVTAATGGIGSEVARALARRGCNVFLTSRTEDRLVALGRELRAMSVGVAHLAADLARPDAPARVAATARDALGPVDVLVNVAGSFLVKPVVETTDEELDAMLALNVRAPFALARAVVPDMLAAGWGRIVNIGSSSAYAGFADTAAYCASKHALLGLSRALHAELRDGGIRTFSVSPGSVRTGMGRQVPGQCFDTFIEPRDVAEYVAFVIGFDGAMVSEEVRLNRMVTR